MLLEPSHKMRQGQATAARARYLLGALPLSLCFLQGQSLP